ncbi:hypothetical protein FEM03_20330 [Phragmitibacter flavus]|uniref:GYF domain-containing protein n=1 Tax=Phragmitibacter flavus TaxID=2576071 RepID=A0A5R8KBS2_9BACT|nr:hypothetical protein [Phragmitibacter flavus]TLD69009.1 hypothetical protein FEM03_20330 [Phragmitibacter flavus]
MDKDEWYLLKVSDNEIFGPAPIGQFRIWASEAKISPLDRISNDERKTWLRAPMVGELQMDWLIEMPDGFLYGPTSIGTLQEFLATGEIDENVTVINTLDRAKTRIKDLPFFQASPQRVRGSVEIDPNGHGEGTSSEPSVMLKQRSLWLEKQVMELQREIGRWQEHAASLRSQFVEATGRDPL